MPHTGAVTSLCQDNLYIVKYHHGSLTSPEINTFEVQSPQCMCRRMRMHLLVKREMADSRSSYTMLEGLWLCNGANPIKYHPFIMR